MADINIADIALYDGKPFSQIPFEYLEALDWGAYEGDAFAGTKPLRLDEFFRGCAKTGVHPALSLNSSQVMTIAGMREIKTMAGKYGVLKQLNIKCPAVDGIASAFSVFGYDIESYTLNVSSGASVSTLITQLDAIGIDKTKVECVIEQFAGSSELTEESVDEILAAGYKAGIARSSHTSVDGSSRSLLSEVDYDYWSERGVTEFTDTSFFSYGLNW